MRCARLAPTAALLTVVLLLCETPHCSSADETSAARPATASGTTAAPHRPAIEATIASLVDFDLNETPLSEVIDDLKQRHDLDIVVDRTALADAGIDLTTLPITAHLKDISLKSALSLVLSAHGLAAIPKHEFLTITTKAQAEQELQTRVYGVADIVGNQANADPKCDGLVDLMVNTIATSTWSDLGGPATIGGWSGSLTISQTPQVHGQIDDLLAAMRSVRKQQSSGQLTKTVFIGGSSLPPKLEKLLTLKLDIKYEETPLPEILMDLRDRAGLEFFLNSKVLSDAGIDSATLPISLQLRNVTARVALGQILHPAGLAWHFQDEVLQITTREQAANKLKVAVYPVADLIGLHSRSALEKKLEFPAASSEDLIDLIVTSTATPTWSDVGGPGTLWGFDPEFPVLVCSQTTEVHEQMGALLDNLRHIRTGQSEELVKQAAAPTKSEMFVLQVYPLKVDEKDAPAVPPKEVALLVKALTGQKHWLQEEAFVQGAAGRLIVRQKPSVQRAIRKILKDIDVLRDSGRERSGGIGGSGLGGRGLGGGGF
ncbi:MAG: hypothetical protein IT427_00040 [Pirellulales bacterium]|nr:hypothetical protein [Pirellulales bacterium]